MSEIEHRDVPTLIHDGKAWVRAEHYDAANEGRADELAENERLSRQLAGAIADRDALRGFAQEVVNAYTGSAARRIKVLAEMGRSVLRATSGGGKQ